jgi:aspartyl-tRNA(Asn)/glutamyl-tRNA(Gln) amidotransferase subunit A
MSISKITGDLAAGKTTARQHLETCLEAIDSEDGRRAFITVNSDAARAEADRVDVMRAAGSALPPFAGVTLSVKDLFDIAGEITRAGSRVLDGAALPPATAAWWRVCALLVSTSSAAPT